MDSPEFYDPEDRYTDAGWVTFWLKLKRDWQYQTDWIVSNRDVEGILTVAHTGFTDRELAELQSVMYGESFEEWKERSEWTQRFMMDKILMEMGGGEIDPFMTPTSGNQTDPSSSKGF